MEEQGKTITPNDLVAYYGDDGGYHSAGYLISSVFDNNKLPPILTINGESVKGAASMQTGGKKKKSKESEEDERFSEQLKGFAIPLGLASLYSENVQMEGGKRVKESHSGVISESLYDRLLTLVDEHKKESKPRKTRRRKEDSEKKSKKGKKTRRNK